MLNNHKTQPYLTNFLIGLGLIGYTLWFYRSSLNLGFNTDAFALILPIHISGLWSSLAWDGSYHYAPVTVSWLWFQHLFLGLNETGYQIINVVQQGFITILVFGLAKELTNNRALALLAALLFVSSASYYEVVLWSIVGTYYHISTFFYLIGLMAFIRFLKNGQKWLYWLFTACVGLSLFAHELTLSLLPVSMVYYLFVDLPTDDRRQFWQPWLNRRAWLNLGKLMLGPVVMVGLFLAVKAMMSLYSDVTGQEQTLRMAIYWFIRGLLAALTFRGDDRFITGQLVNFFGGPERAWVWMALFTPAAIALFVLWFNRRERFLLLWLLGQLLMTQLAIGISSRHLYMPAMAMAILLISIGNRLFDLAITPLVVWNEGIKYFKMPVLYGLTAIVFIIPAYRDLKQAEQLWQHASTANQSLKQTITESLEVASPPSKLYVVNTTRYLYSDGFSAWTFQNGLGNSILLNFPGQFNEINLLYFSADRTNVANGSRRGDPAEIDVSILGDKDYLWLLYLPDEYRFIRLTRSYLAKNRPDQIGVWGIPVVYTRESAPSLDWQEGAWPWLNLPPGQTLNLTLKAPGQGQTWLVVYNLAQEGRDMEIEVNNQVIGLLKSPPGIEPTWRNATLPLPANQSATVELILRGVGNIPANFAQVGLFSPQPLYNAENSRALWWDAEGNLSLAPGSSLSLPLAPCSAAICQLAVTYLAMPGTDFTMWLNNNKPLKPDSPVSSNNSWITTTVSFPVVESPVITFQASKAAPVLIKEISLH